MDEDVAAPAIPQIGIRIKLHNTFVIAAARPIFRFTSGLPRPAMSLPNNLAKLSDIIPNKIIRKGIIDPLNSSVYR